MIVVLVICGLLFGWVCYLAGKLDGMKEVCYLAGKLDGMKEEAQKRIR